MNSTTPPFEQPLKESTNPAMDLAVWVAGSDRFLAHWQHRLEKGLGLPSGQRIDPIDLKGEQAQGTLWHFPDLATVLKVHAWLVQETNAHRRKEGDPVGLISALAWCKQPQPGVTDHLPFFWASGPMETAASSPSHSDVQFWLRRILKDNPSPSEIAESLSVEAFAKPRFDQPWRNAILQDNLAQRLSTSPRKPSGPRF